MCKSCSPNAVTSKMWCTIEKETDTQEAYHWACCYRTETLFIASSSTLVRGSQPWWKWVPHHPRHGRPPHRRNERMANRQIMDKRRHVSSCKKKWHGSKTFREESHNEAHDGAHYGTTGTTGFRTFPPRGLPTVSRQTGAGCDWRPSDLAWLGARSVSCMAACSGPACGYPPDVLPPSHAPHGHRKPLAGLVPSMVGVVTR